MDRCRRKKRKTGAALHSRPLSELTVRASHKPDSRSSRRRVKHRPTAAASVAAVADNAENTSARGDAKKRTFGGKRHTQTAADAALCRNA